MPLPQCRLTSNQQRSALRWGFYFAGQPGTERTGTTAGQTMNSKSDNTEKNEKIGFLDFFRFTKDGKMKSGTVVYSFSLAALFLIVYGAAYYFLIDVLAPLTDNFPVWASDLIGAVVPALAGSLICLIPVLMLSERKYAVLAYLWIGAFELLFLIAMAVQLRDEHDAFAIFIHLFVLMVPAPLILGAGSAWYFYKKQQ